MIKKTDNTSFGKDMDKLEHPYIAGGNVQWDSLFGKLKMLKIELPYDPEISFLDVLSR